MWTETTTIKSILKFSLSLFYNGDDESQHPGREQEKEKERVKVQTKDHTQKCRMHNWEP